MEKAVATRFDKLEAKIDRVIDIVTVQQQEIREMREDIRDLKTSVAGMARSIDALAKAIADMQLEYASMKMQLARHEMWIKQIAEKNGVKLEA